MCCFPDLRGLFHIFYFVCLVIFVINNFNIQVPCHHTALPQFFLLLTIVLHFPGKVLLEESNINMSLRGELENQEQFLPLMQMQN